MEINDCAAMIEETDLRFRCVAVAKKPMKFKADIVDLIDIHFKRHCQKQLKSKGRVHFNGLSPYFFIYREIQIPVA